MASLQQGWHVVHEAGHFHRFLQTQLSDALPQGLVAPGTSDHQGGLRKTDPDLCQCFHRFHLPSRPDLKPGGHIPFHGYEQLLHRRFEEAIDTFLTAQKMQGPSDALSSSLAAAYHRLAFQTLADQVRRSVRAGARVLLGGAPLPGPGNFYAPTVLTAVRPGSPAYAEELFGPVAAIIPVRDEAAAIATANDSIYGLGAAVFTRNRRRGRAIATRLESGLVFINTFTRSEFSLPFGGTQQSGHGRELGAWGLRAFVQPKTVWVA